MKIFLGVIVSAFIAFAAPASAEWAVDAMNEQIEKTNVEVGGVCSGTIINAEERLVLTAYHCITGQLVEVEEKTIDDKTGEISTKKVQKRLPLAIKINKIIDYKIVSSEEHLVKIVGTDSVNDLALLQVIDKDFKPVMAAKLAPDSYEFKRGLRVYAVGNPGIVYGDSITEGIISAPERTIEISGKEYQFFQFSAGVIGGNSGGSILNDNGELIGTVSAGVRGAPISFGVPIARTKEMIKKAGFEKVLK